MKIFYSPNKHGRRINNTNTIKTTQLQSRQKHLKLDSNLDTRYVALLAWMCGFSLPLVADNPAVTHIVVVETTR